MHPTCHTRDAYGTAHTHHASAASAHLSQGRCARMRCNQQKIAPPPAPDFHTMRSRVASPTHCTTANAAPAPQSTQAAATKTSARSSQRQVAQNCCSPPAGRSYAATSAPQNPQVYHPETPEFMILSLPQRVTSHRLPLQPGTTWPLERELGQRAFERKAGVFRALSSPGVEV